MHDDAGHFEWQRMGGDFIVTAQVAWGQAGGKAGWLVRAGQDEAAAYVSATLQHGGPAALHWRGMTGGPVEQAQAAIIGSDVVQLERRGTAFIMSVARFGEPFTAVEAAIGLDDAVDVRLFVAAQAGEDVAAVAFHNVRVVVPVAAGFDRQTDPFGSRLEVMTVADGRRQIVYSTDAVIEAPNWTRDGQALIYNTGGRLVRFDLAQQTHALIDTGDVVNNNNDHVISFDGTMLAISSSLDGAFNSYIYTVPLAGGQPQRVTPLSPSFLHGWSPDGRQVVYAAYRNGDFDIYRIDIAGGEEERLTTAVGLDDGPEYSPDGEYIYFNSVRSGRMQVWRMKPDGSGQEQLTDDDCDNWFPHISPDGRWVVFVSYLPGEVQPSDHPPAKRVYLRLMPRDGGVPTVIAYLYGGQGTMNVPSWSPDGSRIAFVSNTVPL